MHTFNVCQMRSEVSRRWLVPLIRVTLSVCGCFWRPEPTRTMCGGIAFRIFSDIEIRFVHVKFSCAPSWLGIAVYAFDFFHVFRR
jgi:hypothetical protein